MKRHIHMSQSVPGALKNWDKKMWEAVADDNGTTADRLKEKFRILEFKGVKVIPLNGVYCEGYSDQDGCPGHEIKVDDITKGVV